MKFKLFFILIFSFCFLFLNQRLAYTTDMPNKLEILQLLREEKFDELENKLNKYQSDYENGIVDEVVVELAFNSFRNSDPELKIHYDNWVKKYPNSYAAHTAKAKYYDILGWHSRGGKYAYATTDEQFENMRKNLSIAESEFKKALKINNKLITAYAELISINMATSDKDEIEYYKDKGFEIDPNSYLISHAYIVTLKPKWGGSLKELKIFQDECLKKIDLNPNLESLYGYYDLVKAPDDLGAKEKMDILNSIYKNDEHYEYFGKRALLYSELENYDKAIENLNKGLEYYPQNRGYLTLKGRIYKRLEKYDIAMESLNKSLMYDSLDADTLHLRGSTYWSLKKFDEALEDYKKALVYSDNKEQLYFTMAFIYLYDKSDNKNAIKYYKKAIDLNNEDSRYFYQLSVAQWYDKDCEFMDTTKSFEKLCKKTKDCPADQINWAKESRAFAIKKGVCKE